MSLFLIVMPSGLEWLLAFLALALLLLPVFAFARTLESTLKLVAPSRRQLRPSAVWWLMVPGLGMLWAFPMVARFAASVEAESAARGNSRPATKLHALGITAAALSLAYILPLERWPIWDGPYAGGIVEAVTSLGGLVCWTLFWIGAAKWRRKLSVSKGVENHN